MSICPGEFDTDETPKFYTKPGEFVVKLDNNSSNPTLSQRGKDWLIFSDAVLKHIECYTVPQYGDKGCDQCTDYDERDFKKQIKKYANRLDSNMRGTVEAKRDLLKICHYAQMLHDLIEE